MMKLVCEDLHDFLIKDIAVHEMNDEKHFVMKSTSLCKVRPISFVKLHRNLIEDETTEFDCLSKHVIDRFPKVKENSKKIIEKIELPKIEKKNHQENEGNVDALKNQTDNDDKYIDKIKRIKRKICFTEKWKQRPLEIDNQLHSELCKANIMQKIRGYKSQDRQKGLMNDLMFIDYDYVVFLLQQLSCFYCKNTVSLLYENIRDPNQWTLERINNSIGHDKKNVVISCLSCNVRRRTMHYKKYLLTKQGIHKIGEKNEISIPLSKSSDSPSLELLSFSANEIED